MESDMNNDASACRACDEVAHERDALRQRNVALERYRANRRARASRLCAALDNFIAAQVAVEPDQS